MRSRRRRRRLGVKAEEEDGVRNRRLCAFGFGATSLQHQARGGSHLSRVGPTALTGYVSVSLATLKDILNTNYIQHRINVLHAESHSFQRIVPSRETSLLHLSCALVRFQHRSLASHCVCAPSPRHDSSKDKHIMPVTPACALLPSPDPVSQKHTPDSNCDINANQCSAPCSSPPSRFLVLQPARSSHGPAPARGV